MCDYQVVGITEGMYTLADALRTFLHNYLLSYLVIYFMQQILS